MSAPSDQRHTVLLVDDHPDLLASLSFALGSLGPFQVVTAADGAAGLEQVYAVSPDCVVIDVKMPEISGIQLVRALRGDPATAQIPLVILSALIQSDDQLRGLFAGADFYLTKPTKPQELAAVIHQAIALSAKERKQRLEALVNTPPDEPSSP